MATQTRFVSRVTVALQALVALAAVGGLIVSIATSMAVKEVHVMMNSRFTEMLELTRAASRAEGLKQGREEQTRP